MNDFTTLNTKDGQKQGRRKRINFRPVLFFAFFLAFGAASAYGHIYLEEPYAKSVLAAIALGLLLSVLSGNLKNAPFILSAFLLAFALGAVRFESEIEDYRGGRVHEGRCVVAGTVDEIGLYGEFAFVVLTDLSIDGNEESGKLTATLPASSAKKLALSQELLFEATVQKQEEFSDSFYADRVSERIRYEAKNVKNLTVTGKSFHLFRAVRERLRTVLYRGMDQTPASVTYALLTGDSSGIDEGLLENVRAGGVAHIFAVSGLHIGALYSFLKLLLSKTKLKILRKASRFVLVAAILILYGGVCGFSSSVVRAVIMCLAVYFAELFGVKSDPLERVGLAAGLILLVKPASLYSVGFQLSFCAVLGILVLSRSLKDCLLAPVYELAYRYKRRKTPANARGIRSLSPPNLSKAEIAERTPFVRVLSPVLSFVAVTLSAQIATAPVQINAFGSLPAWGILLNALVVPLVGSLYTLFLAFAAVACLFPIAAPVLLWLPNFACTALFIPFQSLSFAFPFMENAVFSSFSAVIYCLICFILSDKIKLSPLVRAILFFLLLFVFVATMYATNGNILAANGRIFPANGTFSAPV